MSTGGAGRRALERAFHELFGMAGALATVEIAGRTDGLIIADALRGCGLTCNASTLDELRRLYFVRLADEMRTSASRVLPGVRQLLDRLSPRSEIILALLTGNFSTSARLKLEGCGLWDYFRFGAYGDDAPDRNGLVPVALDRGRRLGYPGLTPSGTLVIGDTPHDVACAIAGGARSLAVASGTTDEETLQAAGADRVFRDFSDVDGVVRAIEELLADDRHLGRDRNA